MTIENSTQPQPARGACPVRHSEGACPVSGLAAAFDPFEGPYQVDPAEALRWSRDQLPVFYRPKLGYWIVSRYDDIKAIFRDNITFSPAIALEMITPPTPESLEVLKSYGVDLRRTDQSGAEA